MTLTKSRLLPLVCAIAVASGLAFAAACSGQGEGERCSTLADNSGNDDCAGDLICTKAGSLNGSSTDRCCPSDRTQATTPVCAVQSATGIDAGSPTSEAGADGGDGGEDGAIDGATADGATTDSATADSAAGDAAGD